MSGGDHATVIVGYDFSNNKDVLIIDNPNDSDFGQDSESVSGIQDNDSYRIFGFARKN